MAMFIMSANAAGIAGSQFFQASDKASGYKDGWTIIVSLNAVAVLICAGALAQYMWSNRQIKGRKMQGAVEVTEVVSVEGDVNEHGEVRERRVVAERGFYL